MAAFLRPLNGHCLERCPLTDGFVLFTRFAAPLKNVGEQLYLRGLSGFDEPPAQTRAAVRYPSRRVGPSQLTVERNALQVTPPVLPNQCQEVPLATVRARDRAPAVP
jgi:hypothetical protein